MAPLHELTPHDIEPLTDLLGRTDLLVVQPVADGYRGLPLGTRQLLALLPADARHVVVPSVRWSGLHPFHLLVHPPGLERPDPPVVPYHDVRTVVAAAWARAGRPVPAAPHVTEDMVRAVSEASIAELRHREVEHETVVVSDVLERPAGVLFRTINHPGNEVLETLAARVCGALGLPPYRSTIGRPILANIHAPLEPVALAAHGLDVAPVAHWCVDDRVVTTDEVAAAHLTWYAERPEMLDAALARSVDLRRTFGLVVPGEQPC